MNAKIKEVQMLPNRCAQCKKEYKPSKNGVGCQKCAPGVQIHELEFRKPISIQKEIE